MLIGQWILWGCLAVLGIILTIAAFIDGSASQKIACVAITIVVLAGLILVFRWYNTSTASGQRAVKDQHSELNNGIERDIIVTAEDGRVIFEYSGRCDIETGHPDYILFEDQDHKRVMIYKGTRDTILIREK